MYVSREEGKRTTGVKNISGAVVAQVVEVGGSSPTTARSSLLGSWAHAVPVDVV